MIPFSPHLVRARYRLLTAFMLPYSFFVLPCLQLTCIRYTSLFDSIYDIPHSSIVHDVDCVPTSLPTRTSCRSRRRRRLRHSTRRFRRLPRPRFDRAFVCTFLLSASFFFFRSLSLDFLLYTVPYATAQRCASTRLALDSTHIFAYH